MMPAESMVVGFKRHLRAETIPAEAVYLLSGAGVTALSGASIERLAPLLDGTRTLAELQRDALPHLAAAEVGRLLDRLAEADLIEFRPITAAGQRDPAADAYWSLAGLDPAVAAAAVGTARAEVLAIGGADPRPARAALAASGLVVADPANTPPALTFVLCDDYLDTELEALNLAQLASRRPWLLAKLSGPAPWVGPIFRPGQGPCWACLKKRLEGNRYAEVMVRRLAGSGTRLRPPEASLAAGRALGLAAAILEVVKWLAGLRYPGQQALSIMDTLTLQRDNHAVTRRPQCPACGDPGLVAERVQRPIVFSSRPIAARDDSGHRALTHAQMLAMYANLVDPITGIVGELRRDPASPEFLHSCLSGHNRAIVINGVREIAGLQISNGGKGATPLEAQVGALCEAVERYCGTRCGDEPVVRASYRELGGRAVHPAACMLFDERQYAVRAQWNATCAPFHRVPQPFDEDAVIEWTPVWSLLTGEQRLLPTAMLYYSPRGVPRDASITADSNGNAAGGSLEDAIIHGFLELVERDAVALWWYNRTRQPLVNLQSFDDGWLARLPLQYRRIKREVWVLDVTSDLGIPAMAAVSRRIDKAAEDILLGFGAHPDPAIAARRAVGELGQLLPSVIGARADGTGYAPDPHLEPWWRRATVRNQPYLRPDPCQPVRDAASYGYRPCRTLNLDFIYRAAQRAGLDVLVLDQSRPDINMPVVKVIVPGLRHFWPRLAPGRLFDVPVALGRKASPTQYEELNPIPIYL
ncbi:MAG TPA: TOMM precursor leader peptide-binding protein [Streptosporangiaceae bacterium]